MDVGCWRWPTWAREGAEVQGWWQEARLGKCQLSGVERVQGTREAVETVWKRQGGQVLRGSPPPKDYHFQIQLCTESLQQLSEGSRAQNPKTSGLEEPFRGPLI